MSWDGIAQVANIHFHSHLIHTWHDDVTKKQQEVARWGVTTLSKHTQCPMFCPHPHLAILQSATSLHNQQDGTKYLKLT